MSDMVVGWLCSLLGTLGGIFSTFQCPTDSGRSHRTPPESGGVAPESAGVGPESGGVGPESAGVGLESTGVVTGINILGE